MADKPQHTYPSRYPPGIHWAIDEAWGILDILEPGVLNDDIRMLLAGLIAGTLMRLCPAQPTPGPEGERDE